MWSNSDYLPGIDVSAYKENIDWQKVKDSGVAYTFIKATEGTTYLDKYFDNNWSGARRAGVIRGAYHFFIPNIDPVEQANHYLDVVGDILHKSDLPPVIDIESSPKYVYEAFLTLSIEERLERLQKWLEVVEQATNRKPIIYTNFYTWKIMMGNSKDYVDHPLWVANYGAEIPSIPADIWGGNGWKFWQFSYEGSVPGVLNEAAVVDQNIFRGKLEDMHDWIGIENERKIPPNLNNHQMLEAISKSALQFGQTAEDWILKLNLNYMLIANNAERPYDGPAVEDLPLEDNERAVLEEKVQSILTEFKETIYTGLTNQGMINAFYQAAKKLETAGWTLLQKAGLTDIVNQRDALYTGQKVDQMQNLTSDEKLALAEVLGLNLTDFISEEPVDDSEEDTTEEEPVEEDPVGEDSNEEEPVADEPEDEEPIIDTPETEEQPDEEPETEDPLEDVPIEIPDNIFGFPADLTNQDMINAIYQVAEQFNLSGWALLEFAGLTHLIKDRNSVYSGEMLDEMSNLSTQQKEAIAEILGIVLLDTQTDEQDPPPLVDPVFYPGPNSDPLPEEEENDNAEPYPGLVNQDMINLFYQVASKFSEDGWGWLLRSNLAYIASSRDLRYRPYIGPKIEDISEFNNDEKQALLSAIGVAETI